MKIKTKKISKLFPEAQAQASHFHMRRYPTYPIHFSSLSKHTRAEPTQRTGRSNTNASLSARTLEISENEIKNETDLHVVSTGTVAGIPLPQAEASHFIPSISHHYPNTITPNRLSELDEEILTHRCRQGLRNFKKCK